MRRREKKLEPEAMVETATYFRTTGVGAIYDGAGRSRTHAYEEGRWIQVVWPHLPDADPMEFTLTGPVEGPFTLEQAEAMHLAEGQRAWDDLKARRDAAWDRARWRAGAILRIGGYSKEEEIALAEMQLLIFQTEWGYQNTSPRMTMPRPTESDLRFE